MHKPTATHVPHGTPDYSEMRALGLSPGELTIFSSNINPYGPPPAAVEAVRAAATPEMIVRYPDRLSLELNDLLAAYHQLPVDCFLVGNGTADLLWLIGLLHMQRRHVAILGPTFGEYRNVADLMQASVTDLSLPGWRRTADGFQTGDKSIHKLASELHQAEPEVVFVCNPNNPTGQYLTQQDLAILYEAAPKALWIMDEAYAEFMQPPATTDSWVERGNWIVLRSMTKDYALGGLRLGYLIGAPNLVKPLQLAQSPWNTNTFAQVAGCASLREGQQWRADTLARLWRETVALQESLVSLGYRPHPTTVNYFLVPVTSPAQVRQALLAQRMVVRDCSSFGLHTYIRIATQRAEENVRLLKALAELPFALPAPHP